MLSSERKPARPLTRRESEIARLVAEGLTNRDIARKLFISERTAEGHVEQIRNKLGFTSRSQVASWATQNLTNALPATSTPAEPHAEPAPLAAQSASTAPPRSLALPRWPFGRAGLIGVAVLAIAILGAGTLLIVRLTPSPPTLGIYTIAGTGVGGFFGDDGPPAAAELNGPTAIAIDPKDGAVYIVDGNRVRRILRGTITTVVGSGNSGRLPPDGTASTLANLNLTNQFRPEEHGLAVDSEGNVYIADLDDHIVWKATKGANGTISRFAGTGAEGIAGDGQLAKDAELRGPTGLAFDSHGNLYVADSTARNVRVITNGIISTLSLGDVSLSDPKGLTFDNKGNLWIADTSNHQVIRVTPQGEVSSFRLSLPVAVAVDKDDRIYVVDGNQILRIDAAGGKNVFAGDGKARFGGEGKAPAAASLNQPLGVGVDAADNVFVVDTGNNRIREITTR